MMEAQKSPYPPLAINIIAGIMATKDAYSQNYLKGTELVNLFQSLGFPDDYTFVEGRGIQTLDFGEGLSRLAYTQKRLAMINESLQMPITIQKFIERVKEPKEASNSIQEVLSRYNIPLFTQKNSITEKNEDANNSDNAESEGKVQEKLLLEKELLKNEQRRQKMEQSILGEIPTDRPVVFISYSWDSKEHQKWVAKLAEGLTKAGIYVLLDQYLEDGTLLPQFMDLGIDRADKVLVIGTDEYLVKSYDQGTGVAFEDCIIRSQIFQHLGSKKFIPCLRKGEFKTAFPIIIRNNKGHNFVEDKNFEDELETLCREIWQKPKTHRPTLGNIPDYAK